MMLHERKNIPRSMSLNTFTKIKQNVLKVDPNYPVFQNYSTYKIVKQSGSEETK